MSRHGNLPDPPGEASSDQPNAGVSPTIADERADSEVALDTLRKYASPRVVTPPARSGGGRPRSTTINGVMLIVVLVAVAFIAIRGEVNNSRYTDATSAEAVAANRVKASAEVRGFPGMPCPDPLAYNADTLTLECANRFVVAVGGTPVPDPGEATTPTQMGIAVARALDRFDRALEVRGGKEPQPGVSTPPTSGRFRGTR